MMTSVPLLRDLSWVEVCFPVSAQLLQVALVAAHVLTADALHSLHLSLGNIAPIFSFCIST
jgi:hypothetical protein